MLPRTQSSSVGHDFAGRHDDGTVGSGGLVGSGRSFLAHCASSSAVPAVATWQEDVTDA